MSSSPSGSPRPPRPRTPRGRSPSSRSAWAIRSRSGSSRASRAPAETSPLTYAVGAGSYRKGLELLKGAVPRVRLMAVLSNPANPGMSNTLQELRETGRSLGVELRLVEARGPDQFDAAYGAMVRARAGALLLVTEAMFAGHRAQL